MHPCFMLLVPPRALDGPMEPRAWRRLLLPLSALLVMQLAMLLVRAANLS